LHDELGADRVWPLVSEATMSAVNAAEVQGKLVKLGIDAEAAWEAVIGSVQDVVAFDARQAEVAGNLAIRIVSLGLSLGDRACLALATILELPVYTADQVWAQLDAGIEINLIR
jgi:PIN domain nuclease of toxin-antitoxin system